MSREKYTTTIDVDILKALRRASNNRNIPHNRIIEQAITDYLNPEDYKSTSLEYLQRIDQKHSRILSRIDLVLEILGTFIRLWFRKHPKTRDDERKAKLAQEGEERFETFKGIIQNAVREGLDFRRAFDAAEFDTSDFHKD